jgi:hypothetical protein
MVCQMITGPPGLDFASLANVMGGNSLAVDAVAACATLTAHGKQQGLQDQHPQPGPMLLGRALMGAPPGLDKKVVPQAHGQWRKAVDKQRWQMEGSHAQKEAQEITVASQTPHGVSDLPRQQSSSLMGQQHPPISSAHGAQGLQSHTRPVTAQTTSAHAAPVTATSTTTNLTAAAPLSLADALGFGGNPGDNATASAPSPLASSKPSAAVAAQSASVTPCSVLEQEQDDEVDAFIFAFTIRVAGGATLGIATSVPEQHAPYLRIDSVMPGGAVEAWNRQCGSSGAPEKVLLAGDKIVRVNTSENPEAMLHECETCRLLRMLIVRTPIPCHSTAQQQASTPKAAQLRKAEPWKVDLPAQRKTSFELSL